MTEKYYLAFSENPSKNEANQILAYMIELKIEGIDSCSRYGNFEQTRQFLVRVLHA